MSELAVYLSGTRAGSLIRKSNGNLQFRYARGYMGPPLSQSMPVQGEAHPHATCRAVFGGLLLEGEGREVIAREFGISVGNDYALLEELGGDCAGALVLLPPDAEPPTVPETRELSESNLDRVIRELPERPLAIEPEAGIRLSLAGAQPKLPVIIRGRSVLQPLNSAAATTHIIKPEPDRFPGLVDNEAFCMKLAGRLGLPVAAVSKAHSQSGIPYLLVERYDRDLSTDPIRRLHQEDFCQALGHPSDRKYQQEGGPSVTDAVSLLRAASAVPARDLQTFWRALIFNWLIGNCDAHSKNFSLLHDSGVPTLAPLYDLVSTTLYDKLTRRLAMSIGGARRIDDVTVTAWTELAASAGFSRRFATAELAELSERALVEVEVLRERDDELIDNLIAGIVDRAESVKPRKL